MDKEKNTLTWTQIETKYNQEWVELIDYDWPDGSPYPRSGVVRTHSPYRKEFYQFMDAQRPKPQDSALVYVGTPPRESNVIYVNPLKLVPTWT